MFIWVTLPQGTDIDGFIAELEDNKVVVVPGKQFYCDGGADTADFRLSFSLASDAEIEKATKIIGDLTHKYCK